MTPHRRRSTTVAALATLAALTIGAGCSTFTDNSVAAKVNGSTLSIDTLQRIARDLPVLGGSAPDEFGELAGSDVRVLINTWVSSAAIITGLQERGLAITAEDRQAAEQQYSSRDADSWSKLSEPTRQLLIDYTAARTVIAKDPSLTGEVQSLYDQGVAASGLLCVRIMAFDTEDEATAVLEELRSGADFAELANDHPLDPAGVPNGGVLTDTSTGAECLDASGYPVVAQALADVPIGESSPVTTLGSEFFFLIVQRPFDEVEAEATTLLSDAGAQGLIATLIASADVSVDSRYGQWDATNAEVVATS